MPKLERAAQLTIDGFSIREVAERVGISKATASKIKAAYIRAFEKHGWSLKRCSCGKPANHKGWCRERLQRSPKRIAFLKRWHAKQKSA